MRRALPKKGKQGGGGGGGRGGGKKGGGSGAIELGTCTISAVVSGLWPQANDSDEATDDSPYNECSRKKAKSNRDHPALSRDGKKKKKK